MSNRDEKLWAWEKHKTPRDVAQYFRSEGSGVGREYNTHGDVWAASEAIVQTGLLHLILDKLEEMQKPKDLMKRHPVWLEIWHPLVTKEVAEFEKHRKRLTNMFGGEADLGCDMSNCFDVHYSSDLYLQGGDRHKQRYESFKKQLMRLKSVRKPEDVINLEGIGKKKAAQILEKMRNGKLAGKAKHDKRKG